MVPNKFPALGIEGKLNRQAEGMFDKMNGIGAHEVIIETPEHAATLATFRLKDRRHFWAFRDRILDLKKDRRFKYILFSRTMENRRRLPGALALAVDRPAYPSDPGGRGTPGCQAVLHL